MKELKVYSQCYDGTDGLFYLKSEVDKVVADLEESHKMEVEQLLIEIAELKKKLETTVSAASITCGAVSRCNEKLRHQKYKRCLDKAAMCEARYDEEDAEVNGFGASWEYITKEMKYWDRWRWRWETLAEKFKEVI